MTCPYNIETKISWSAYGSISKTSLQIKYHKINSYFGRSLQKNSFRMIHYGVIHIPRGHIFKHFAPPPSTFVDTFEK